MTSEPRAEQGDLTFPLIVSVIQIALVAVLAAASRSGKANSPPD